MNGYLQALRKYAVFQGRAGRRAYWFFVLFQILAVLLISFIERQLAIANPEILFGWFTAAYLAATLPPALAATARRLHDSGRSAKWLLLCLVPLIGLLALLALTLWHGTAGANRHGPDPRPAAA